MSVEVLKTRLEQITRAPPVYKDILELGRSINQAISAKPTHSLFPSKKHGLHKLKRTLNNFTSKQLFSKHKKGFMNTVHEENRRRTIRRGKPGIKRSVLNKIRANRNVSRSRASRSRVSR